MSRNLTAIVILAIGALFSILILAVIGQNPEDDSVENQNVFIENGKQVIEIVAKGGFRPRVTQAKSGMPTVLRIKTNNTFDCSSTIVIPALQYRARLESSGITEVEIPMQPAGKNIRGICAMGMYGFNIQFN